MKNLNRKYKGWKQFYKMLIKSMWMNLEINECLMNFKGKNNCLSIILKRYVWIFKDIVMLRIIFKKGC